MMTELLLRHAAPEEFFKGVEDYISTMDLAGYSIET
jgi:hypothetical protein